MRTYDIQFTVFQKIISKSFNSIYACVSLCLKEFKGKVNWNNYRSWRRKNGISSIGWISKDKFFSTLAMERRHLIQGGQITYPRLGRPGRDRSLRGQKVVHRRRRNQRSRTTTARSHNTRCKMLEILSQNSSILSMYRRVYLPWLRIERMDWYSARESRVSGC